VCLCLVRGVGEGARLGYTPLHTTVNFDRVLVTTDCNVCVALIRRNAGHQHCTKCDHAPLGFGT